MKYYWLQLFLISFSKKNIFMVTISITCTADSILNSIKSIYYLLYSDTIQWSIPTYSQTILKLSKKKSKSGDSDGHWNQNLNKAKQKSTLTIALQNDDLTIM